MDTSDPQLLVSTDWLAAHLGAPDLRVLDASWHMPDERPRRPRRVRGRPYPRRALLRHRRDLRRPVEPAAHGAAGREVRQPDARDGHRRRPPGRGLRQPRPVQRRPGLVAVPAVRQGPTSRCSTAACRSGRPRAGRSRTAGPSCATATSPPAATRASSATSPRSRRPPSSATRRSSTPARPRASAARSPSRGRACAPATSPARGTCHYATLLNPDGTMKDEAGLRAAFEAAGVDVDEAGRSPPAARASRAAILSLALERLGNRRHALYDGSWAEWGAYPDLKVERG